MKKALLVIALFFASVFTMASCAGEKYEIAMVTDSGGIDDKSFNQSTWEGIVEYATANEKSYKYYKPREVSDKAYLRAIKLAVRGGAKIVVTPGYLFETAIYKAQSLYPDVKFVLIDGEPHTADYGTYKTEENTLNILFDEHEVGFLAGYVAVKSGKFTNLGFFGGMSVPAVQRLGSAMSPAPTMPLMRWTSRSLSPQITTNTVARSLRRPMRRVRLLLGTVPVLR